MQASGTVTAGAATARPRAAGASALRLLTPLAPLALYLVLATATFVSAWRDPFVNQVGYRGDPQEYLWFWTWTQYALGHGLSPFFTTYIDYPAGVNLLWNTSMPLVGLLTWPVASTLGLPFTLNLVATCALALSAWTAFLLLRRVVASTVAAGAGGLLYGFSPYMLTESMTHVHVTLAFLPPLILLLLDEIVRVRRRPQAVMAALLALACAAQFLISEELLVSTGITAAILLALAAALWPQHVRARPRAALPPLLLALTLFLALLAYPLSFQLFGPRAIHGLIHPERGMYVTDALNFFMPTQVQQLAPRRAVALSQRFTGTVFEWTGYVGIPLALLLLFTSIRHRASGWVRLASLGAALIALLSMGAYLHVGGVVHQHLPVFALALVFLLLQRWLPGHVVVLLAFAGWLALDTAGVLRHVIPSRLMVAFFLLAAVVVAVFLDSAIRAGGARAWLGGAAVLVALLPLVPREPFPTSVAGVPAFFTSPAVDRIPDRSVAVVFPMAGTDTVAAMQWQAVARMRFKMPEGYAVVPEPGAPVASFEAPPSKVLDVERQIQAGGPPPVGDEATRREIASELAGWHVQTVVVGPMAHEDRLVAFLTWALGRDPEHEGGVYLWPGLAT